VRRVLIVESDHDIQGYYIFLLSNMDLELVLASDGAAALELLGPGGSFDLIVMGTLLRDISGEGLFRVVRVDRGLDTPVIIASVDEGVLPGIEAIGPIQGFFLMGGPGEALQAMVSGILGEES
jgi:CheY-like chemotaxis protein